MFSIAFSLRIQKDKNQVEYNFYKTLLVLLFLTPVILIFANLSFHSAGVGAPLSGARGRLDTPPLVAPLIEVFYVYGTI